MSIKDRIKMFQNISASNKQANTQKKTQIPQGNSTMTQSKKQTIITPPTSNNNNAPKKSNVQISKPQDNVVLKPSQLKNNPGLFSSTMTKSQSIRPTNNQPPSWAKNKPLFNSQPQAPIQKSQSQKYEIQSGSIAKPSDLKKKFNQLASQNKIIFAPIPQVEIKKTQSQVTNHHQQPKKYQVQTTIPKVSVKQNAEKFSAFYNSKNTQAQQQKLIHHQHQTEQDNNNHYSANRQNNQTRQEIQNNHTNLNIPNSTNLVYQPPHESSHQHQQSNAKETNNRFEHVKEQITKQQVKNEPQAENSNEDTASMLLRLKNKNKRKKLEFDSDED